MMATGKGNEDIKGAAISRADAFHARESKHCILLTEREFGSILKVEAVVGFPLTRGERMRKKEEL
jgi:hypothetical protein